MTPPYSFLAHHWNLDTSITFLNHGSFGGTPVAVLKKQRELQDQMEAEPVRFMIRELEPLWDESRRITARFLGAQTEDLVFVRNTTMGVNTVFHSLNFEEGDEVLIHDHIYGACLNTIRFYSEQKKFHVRTAHIPYPVKDDDTIVEALLKEVTTKTRLLFIDHITSATGMIFPVDRIVREFHQRGIEVFIDGAHAPGMTDLMLDELDADYYTGNCHKWICSPKGSAILHVRKDKQEKIRPIQVSHNYDRNSLWAKQFFWPGTDDYTPYLCVPFAIEYMGNLLPGGWEELRERNRDLALQGRKHLAGILHTELPVPDHMIGHLGNVLIGNTQLPPYGFNYIHPVQEKLFAYYKIEVPIITYSKNNPRLWVRIAAQAYNTISQIEYLGESLKEILEEEKLIR